MTERGYKYRKRKRELADFILSKINTNAFDDPEPEYFETEPNSISISAFAKKFPDHTFDQYLSAVALLEFNKHILLSYPEEQLPEFDDPFVSTTHSGMEAHYEGYYYKENQKDSIETFELRTRWILPIASIAFSLAALAMSILNYYHPRK
jgi:lipopolysaccharide export LptBFGC system permease protein LptF